jgi:hypothetical protein
MDYSESSRRVKSVREAPLLSKTFLGDAVDFLNPYTSTSGKAPFASGLNPHAAFFRTAARVVTVAFLATFLTAVFTAGFFDFAAFTGFTTFATFALFGAATGAVPCGGNAASSSDSASAI